MQIEAQPQHMKPRLGVLRQTIGSEAILKSDYQITYGKQEILIEESRSSHQEPEDILKYKPGGHDVAHPCG